MPNIKTSRTICIVIICTLSFIHICLNTLVNQQKRHSYLFWLSGVSNPFSGRLPSTDSQGPFSMSEKKKKRVSPCSVIKGSRLYSDRHTFCSTYWVVWGCYCWSHRFPHPTCQRHFPSLSLSLLYPCVPLSSCGVFVSCSFWAHAHQCRWCGVLQKRCGQIRMNHSSWTVLLLYSRLYEKKTKIQVGISLWLGILC